MKHTRFSKLFSLAFLLLFSVTAFSQLPTVKRRIGNVPATNPDNGTVRYPDGRAEYPTHTNSQAGSGVHYPDGSVHYPNGKIIYRDGTVRFPNGNIKYPDGRILRPDGTVIYRDQHPGNLPPGQAKKLFGKKSARDFAPGHLKKQRGYDNDEWGSGKKKHRSKNKNRYD